MDPGNAHNRLLEAQQGAGNFQAVIQSGAVLLAIGKSRPNLPSVLRDAARGYVLSGPSEDRASRLAFVQQTIGFDYVEAILVSLAETGDLDRSIAAAMLGQAATLDTGIRMAVLIRQRMLPFDDLCQQWIAGLPEHGAAVAALTEALTMVLQRDQDHVHAALDRAAAPGLLDHVQVEVAARWALAAAMSGHATLSSACTRIARELDFLPTLRVWRESSAVAEDVWAAYGALARAQVDHLALAQAALTVGLELNDHLTKEIAEVIVADSSPQKSQNLLAFVRVVVESPRVSASLTAAFCRDHFDELAETAQGASLMARAFAASGEWEMSLRSLDALCTLTQDPAWAIGRSYFIAARLGLRGAGPRLYRETRSRPSSRRCGDALRHARSGPSGGLRPRTPDARENSR